MKSLCSKVLMNLVVFAQLFVISSSDCWWTDCQPNSWAVTGCGQYNRTEKDIEGCEGGSKYYCCEDEALESKPKEPTPTVPPSTADCWWTACQPNSWAVTGCGQYNRTEKDIEGCEGGSKYYCCEDEALESKPKESTPTVTPSTADCWWTACQPNSWAVTGCGQYNRTEKDIEGCEGGSKYYCCEDESLESTPTESTPSVPPSTADCWWTACQPNSWAVTGCSQYNRKEKDIEGCEGGSKYYCCEDESLESTPTESTPSVPPSTADCWWTACQPNSWAVTGCSQYNRKEKDIEGCEGGSKYYCCEDESLESTPTESTPSVPPSTADCWWTACQPNSWAVTGCGQYNRTEKDIEGCEGGSKYYCCEDEALESKPKESTPTVTPSTADCWWTACQPNSWAVTGCGQYNRTEKDIEGCEGGSKYYCCEDESLESTPTESTPSVPPSTADCWWTACQPNSWAVTGCSQYNRKEKDIEGCEGGSKYYCCEDESLESTPTESTPSVPPSTADCWWTACQPNSWAVTGCGQYNRTEKDIEGCEGGSKYYCCEDESLESKPKEPTPTVPPSTADCWWTACQPNSWAVTGCGQYNRKEKDIEGCEGGSKYYCCEDESLESTPTGLTPTVAPSTADCWWTGCQLKSWGVTGCDQYNRTQIKIKDCNDGYIFYCCPRDGSIQPPKNQTESYRNCGWSPCQPSNWTERGCPSYMIEINQQSCGENEGDMFECCEKNQEKENEEVNLISGDSFKNLVKFLLLKGKNFTVEPDSLPCLSVDQDKTSILQIKNEGIYTCDLCPYFPHQRFVNIFLSNEPYMIEYNLIFGECFGYCFDRNDCVALSYDSSEHTCYIFNNTVGNLIQGSQWTTVFMSQPIGVLQNWTYRRHTLITGEAFRLSKEASFQNCLKKCGNLKDCNYASYSIVEQLCSLFSTQGKINYVDLVYGYISAFKIYSLRDSDYTSRFIEVGDDIFDSSHKLIRETNRCTSGKNETHSAFYAKSCFTSNELGCNTETGCKTCYYPENTNAFQNLVICPDSEWIVYSKIKESIQKSLNDCLHTSNCIAVGYDSKTQSTKKLSFDNFATDEFSTMFIMRYPIIYSENHSIIAKYDFLLEYDIKQSDDINGFQQFREKSFKECVNIFESKSELIRMAYVNRTCKVSSKEVKYLLNSGKSITVLKKPEITSPVLNYLKTPGMTVEKSQAREKIESCSNCEEFCANKCSEEYRDWCSHFLLVNNASKSFCLFFDFYNDTVAGNIKLLPDEQIQLFTKLSTLNFTLESFNELNPFQSSDIYNCFTDSSSQQTSTSLTTYDSSDNTNNSIQIRRKRGFFDFIKKAVEAVGNFVVDTVKGVVDTAKGVVNTVKNVVKGDFKKAKDSFINIPIVKDVRNAVDLGKAVVTGDWDKAREKGSELLQGQALDIATSFIPVAGKFIGRGLKAVGKAIKKQPKGAKRVAQRDINNVNENNKKVRENNKGHDQKRNNCKKRNKRATGKRKTPGSCDDDEENLCPNVHIRDVIESTLSGCKNRKKNAICEYECEPGYDEPNKDVKCIGRGNQRPDWTPRPNCDKISCGSSFYPLISLQTPHVTNFGSTDFGKFITVYVVLYNKWRKLPLWSIALHQSTQFKSKDYAAKKAVERANSFKPFPCNELIGYQAQSSNYVNSGWDQGHLTPANIARWSEKARLSSNLFINVAPQDPFTNRGPWKRLETVVECFSRKYRSLVATGICGNAIGKTSGGLEIPSCYWKMICYRDENAREQVVGFMTSNTHPTPLTETEKEKRRREVYTPLSQAEIRRELQKLHASFRSPWITAARTINAGRAVAIGTQATWFPVNPLDCERAIFLSDVEREAWVEGLPKPKKKKKTGRKKRETTSNIKRGCHSVSELRNMQALLGIDSDGEDDGEGENSSKPGEAGGTLVEVQKCNKRIIGYYTSWGDKEISVRELQRLTHVVYAFLEMREDGSVDVGSADRNHAANLDEELRKSKKRLTNLMEIGQLYPHVKILFAVGGWENSQYFSATAANPQKRVTFIASIVKLIQRYGFDGVDIDWEYPVTGGASEGIPDDKQNYVTLMKEIRSALDNLANEVGRSEKFLLSFAGAAGQWTLDPGFDLPGLLKFADFVNIMTYDYFGAWASKWGAYTGPPAPLYFGMPPRFSGKTNVDWTVKYYTCKTQLPHKLNIGVPFYGRYWKNVGAPVDGKDGMWRTASQVNGIFEGGYVAWNKIPEFLGKGGFEENFHEKSRTPYAWNAGSKEFLGYENKKSLEFKVDYAVKKNVGGLMIWSAELDDDDLTLLNTVYKASLCDKTNPYEINHKCSPIDEKRWWTSEDGDDMAGLCGRSAPLYKGYYPVCDPDDPGYSCCGASGYCGSGEKYCNCPTCKNYGEHPEKILEDPIKPSVPVTWYFLNAEDGKRGRCGKEIPKINGAYPTCNPDDDSAFCCSNGGYCGSKSEFCDCKDCVNFKKDKNYRF